MTRENTLSYFSDDTKDLRMSESVFLLKTAVTSRGDATRNSSYISLYTP